MILDDRQISVSCAKCKHTFKERIGLLATSPKIPCPGCGVTIQVDGRALLKVQKRVDKKMEKMRKTLASIREHSNIIFNQGND